MKSLPEMLRSLQASGFIKAQIEDKGRVTATELLTNGRVYCEQLLQQWRLRNNDNVNKHFIEDGQTFHNETSSRVDFIKSQQLRENVKFLRSSESQCPALIKMIQHGRMGNSPSASQIQFIPNSDQIGHRQLVSEYFFHSACGLEKFHNIQREQKIWWMRFSANPSRYQLEPYDLQTSETEVDIPSSAQSITIKSRFHFGIADLEHITLVPLRDANLENSEDYELYDERSGKNVLPAVIRSVINLEEAACALLLDGYDNNRDDMLQLNRKLAPYQCVVAVVHSGASPSKDLSDLCDHETFVMRRAGLRVREDDNIFTNCPQKLDAELETADSIGIPYSVIIDEQTLRNGILKLRNRDTTLAEQIHISDIPSYLKYIFTH